MSATTVASHGSSASGHGPSPKNNSGLTGFIYMIPIIFIGFIILKFLFSSSGDKEVKNENNGRSNSSQAQVQQPYTKSVSVNYGSEYGDFIYLPSGFDYFFEGASEPYSYTNGNLEARGEKGEDATGTFGDNPSNKKLRFKSTNGEKGNLKIILTKKN